MPPVAPQVTYQNGMLTIIAQNSTLADILHAVSVRTGATVDAPGSLMNDRVAARVGPGTPREVLTDLLAGPRFDYILVGSDNDPNGVRSIILTANAKNPLPPSPGPATSMPIAQTRPRPNVPQEEMEDEAADETPEPEQQAQPQPPPAPPNVQGQPFMTGRPMPPDRMQQQPGGQGNVPGQQVKTPEQLLEELRKLQQQGNNPNTTNPQR